MPRIFDRLTDKKARDIKVLIDFVAIYCREKHGDATKTPFAVKDNRLSTVVSSKDIVLCADCQKLLNHGIAKLMLCPYDPKPMCKKCPTHCYAPGYREKMREVMRFSGLYLIKHGRLDLMAHYLL